MVGQKRKSINDSSDTSSTNTKKGKTAQQTSRSMFLIDGLSPIQPHPMLTNKNYHVFVGREARGRGRQRSVDVKGLILELIEEIYPPLVCPECFEYSQARSDADDHLRTFHHGSKIFACASPACAQKYSSRAGLRYHLEHGHTVTALNDAGISISKRPDHRSASKGTTAKSVINSTTTDKNSANKYNLSTELQKKLDARYPLLTCPTCHKNFTRKTHVIKHLVNDHQGEEPYKCVVEQCKHTKAYSTREGLLYHLANYHE